MLDAGQRICPYCDSLQINNSNETLLDELMILKRKYELASAQGDKLRLDALLADEFVSTLAWDGGEPSGMDKKAILESDWTNKNLFCYGYSQEILLERTDDAAKVSCIDTTCDHYPKGFPLYPSGEALNYTRVKINFVCRAGRWQIASIDATSIDVEGNDVEYLDEESSDA